MQIKIKSSSLQKQSGNPSEKQIKDVKEEENKQPRPIKKGRIILGICAMKKKVQSKPMKQILARLVCKQIEIIEMWSCLQHHWSLWPKVDALICFYSDGFPYLMAWRYVKLHKPFLINSLDKQQLLWDRTVVYDILKKIKVPVAKHYYVIRDMNYIDQLEARGFGNIAPDPLDLQIPRHFNCKVRSMQSSDQYMFKPKSKTRPSYRHYLLSDPLEILPIAGRHQNIPVLNKINEEQQSRSRQDIIKEAPLAHKNHSRYAQYQYQTIQEDTDHPTLLRRFVEKRNAHLKNYQVEQGDDFVLIKHGAQVKKLKKPLIQKPFDSQNHEICVYYPESMGGGRKKLFRKVKDQSSLFEDLNQLRKDGNYIYQQFLPTNAFDIKVYTIGSYYMYAEARRSPTLDGVVQRNQQGKQVRYPVILSPDEKFICNKIVQEFEQEVCGFDILRANGRSYVCDVNGWSFVKGNPKYWDDCAYILKKKIMDKFFPGKNIGDYAERKSKHEEQENSRLSIRILNPKVEQLRSIVSIFRHGDRSPKLKLKIKTNDKRFLQYFKNTDADELKYKDGNNLTNFLNIAVSIISELKQNDPYLKDYLQMKIVLQSRGHFDGLTRKLQLKVQQREKSSEQGIKGNVKKVLIVLKWGGQLSYTGYLDAIALGEKMRKQRYDNHDCLSLYSSYRHDVKTYASDEGRCIKTAAAFLKGFLSIEGELAPIISSMVMADTKAQKLLDCTSSQNHSALADELQERLSQLLNNQEDLMENYIKYCGQGSISEAMKEIIQAIGHPRKILAELNQCLKDLSQQIQIIYEQNWQEQYLNERASRHEDLVDEEKCEGLIMIDSRWLKLKKEFYDSDTKKYNISKIPDIYDTIRHDLRKNSAIFKKINQQILDSLHQKARILAYFVVINQYGIKDEERLRIAQDVCLPLIEKMKVDLMFWMEKSSQDLLWKYRNNAQIDNWRHIRTRLYFTSASHMYSLINILILGENKLLLQKTPKEQLQRIINILYMGYLSHIQFRLYQNLTKEDNDPNRFRLEISLSTEYKQDKQMKQFTLGGSDGFTINEINEFFKAFLSKGSEKELPSSPTIQKSE